MNRAIIELHVPDFNPVRKFYSQLGFKVLREEEVGVRGGYLVMGMEDNILCFYGGSEVILEQKYFSGFPQDTKPGYRVEIILQVNDLTEYYERIKDLIEIIEPLKLRHWGLQDFRLKDPFGFYLRVTSVHDSAVLNHTR